MRNLFIVADTPDLFLAVSQLQSTCALELQHMLLTCWDAGTPELLGSVVVTRRLSCPVSCGILDPQPWMEPTPPELEGEFLHTGPWGKPMLQVFLKLIIKGFPESKHIKYLYVIFQIYITWYFWGYTLCFELTNIYNDSSLSCWNITNV